VTLLKGLIEIRLLEFGLDLEEKHSRRETVYAICTASLKTFLVPLQSMGVDYSTLDPIRRA
jgi:hypothetical protein